jgi:hypothetical protein
MVYQISSMMNERQLKIRVAARLHLAGPPGPSTVQAKIYIAIRDWHAMPLAVGPK